MIITKRSERAGLLTIQFLALVFAAIALASGAIAVATALGGEAVELTLPAAGTLAARTVGDPDAVGAARILNGSFSSATVMAADLGVAVRALVALGAGFACLTQVTIALAIAYMCWRLHQDSPFATSTTRAVSTAAVALSIGSLLSQSMTGFATWLAIDELELDVTQFPLEMSFNVFPILAGLALLLVAGAFQFGERLQRDSEGLV